MGRHQCSDSYPSFPKRRRPPSNTYLLARDPRVCRILAWEFFSWGKFENFSAAVTRLRPVSAMRQEPHMYATYRTGLHASARIHGGFKPVGAFGNPWTVEILVIVLTR